MTVRENELGSMLFGELWMLHQRTSAALTERLIRRVNELELGLSILYRRDLIPATPKAQRIRRPYPKVLPKYRNPLLPLETWSGRGRQPRWLAAAIKEGRNIEDFKI
jgi:DNA-binding protein H-NS